MPTERFYRLPEAKKQIIREAAMKEFARVPLEKASINKIIQNADISRGSFYTYFEDKMDVVQYIFEDGCEQMRDFCEGALDTNGGNYFDMLDGLFDLFIHRIKSGDEMFNLIRNVFSYDDSAKVLGFKGMPGCGDSQENEEFIQRETIRWIYDRIDKVGLIIKSEKEFMAAVMMGTFALLSSVKAYYNNPERLDFIREVFRSSLVLLKRGMYQSQ